MQIGKNTFWGPSRKVFNTLPAIVIMSSALALSGCGNPSLPNIFGNKGTAQTVPAQSIPASSASNDKNLFGVNLRTDDERLNRLERAVQGLRNDFDTVQPSIRRLMAIESDMQELIGELRKLSQEQESAFNRPAPVQPIQVAPATRVNIPVEPAYRAPTKPTTYQNNSAPPVQNGVATIYDVRTGEHPGRTRIVMDVNTATNYTVDIDNNENIMVIDLPNTNWTAAKTMSLGKSPVISSYKVESNESGNIMIVQLKKNAKIGYKATLPSNSGSGKRIVIDVNAL